MKTWAEFVDLFTLWLLTAKMLQYFITFISVPKQNSTFNLNTRIKYNYNNELNQQFFKFVFYIINFADPTYVGWVRI